MREPLLVNGSVERRACEEAFSVARIAIDKASGGAQGWQPNIQPGAPLAPRIEAMINGLERDFELWTPDTTNKRRLMIECFPAEAIWAAKRQGWLSNEISAAQAKAYKKQNGNLLNKGEVVKLVKSILSPFGKACDEALWDSLIDRLLTDILQDLQWKKDELYPGGKMLDDVVDTMLCLSTAISYSIGNSHAWVDRNKPDDGHIIGPGSFQLTEANFEVNKSNNPLLKEHRI